MMNLRFFGENHKNLLTFTNSKIFVETLAADAKHPAIE